MIFIKTVLQGVYLVELERREDERGFFARAWGQDEASAQGINARIVQCNISFNQQKGTLRGMHYQIEPYPEAKWIRCTRGSLLDVILDLRAGSQTFGQWIAVELDAQNRRMVHVPEGFAHGFQTLTDETEVFYQMSEFYHPECARGVRWDDPFFAIDWPLPNPIVSDRDRSFPQWGVKR